MTTKVAAREGFRWFREAAGLARRHALAWVVRAVVLVLGSTALGLAIGSLFGLLTNVAPSTGPVLSLLVPLLSVGLTGPLLVAAWAFAMREAGDVPAPTRRDWVNTVPAAIFWLLVPNLAVWIFLKLLNLVMGDGLTFFNIASLFGRLLSFWPVVTLMVGGVLLDQVRNRPDEPWFSVRPWKAAMRLFRRHWAPLLTGWLLPWAVLSVVYMLIVVMLTAWMKSAGLPIDAAHLNSGAAWALRIITVSGLFIIGLVANLALVVGYLQIRATVTPAIADGATSGDDAARQRGARATREAAEESFPPLQ